MMRIFHLLFVTISLSAMVPLPAVGELHVERIIEGRITTSGGLPVPNVLVRASPSWHTPFERRRYVASGIPTDEPVSAAAERMAEQEVRRRNALREAYSDETGVYRIKGLEERRYVVEAFAEGFLFSPRSGGSRITLPGSELDFNAGPVVGVAIDVVLPDGTRPVDPLVIEYEVPKEHEALKKGHQLLVWGEDDQRTIFLPPGGGVLRTKAGLHGQYASGDVPIDLVVGSAPDPITLNLHPRTCLVGRMVYPDGAGVWGGDVFLAPWPDGEDQPTLQQLVSREDLGMRQGQTVLGKQPGGRDRFHFYDLSPGRYVVAYSPLALRPQDKHELVAIRTIEVLDGINEIELEVEDDRLGPSLDVRVEDPEGNAIPEATVRVERMKSKDRSGTVQHKTARMDPYTWRVWILPQRKLTLMGETLAPASGDRATYTIGATCGQYGTWLGDWRVGDESPMLMRFAPPSVLVVTLEGYGESAVAGHTRLSLTPTTSAKRGRVMTDYYMGYGGPIAPDESGVAVIDSVAPGNYDLTLYVEGDNDRFAAFESVHLATGAGTNRQSLKIPEFFTLEVEVLRSSSPMQYWLRSKDPHAFGAGGRRLPLIAGPVVFPRVRKGAYELLGPGGTMKLEVDKDMKVRFEP